MIKKEKYKQIIIIAAIILTIIVGIIIYFTNNFTKEEDFLEDINEEENIVNEVTINTIIDEEVKPDIVVHVTGQVVNPGIVKVKDGSRVIDAIEAAGGATSDAKLDLINLAYVLEDGIKIYVPSNKDEEEFQIQTNTSNTNKPLRVNINTATVNELEKLPGIGTSIAQRIVTYRTENGKFNTIEDLKNVSGIGESKLNNIRAYVYVK